MPTPIEASQPSSHTEAVADFDEASDSTIETTETTQDALPAEARSLLNLAFDHQTRQDYYQICGRW